jgi:hypothetical protein
LNEGDAILGLVFGGYNAPVLASAQVADGGRHYSYEWTVTIPAGETRRLMHFVVQGRPGFPNYAAAINRTTAIAALSDPVAWADLTFEELATIVNFPFFQ